MHSLSPDSAKDLQPNQPSNVEKINNRGPSKRSKRGESGRRVSQIRPSVVTISPSPNASNKASIKKVSIKSPKSRKKPSTQRKKPKSKNRKASSRMRPKGKSGYKGKASSRKVPNSSRKKGNGNRTSKATKRNLQRASKYKRGTLAGRKLSIGERRSSQAKPTDCCSDGKYCARGGKMMYKPGRFGFSYDGNTITDVTRGLQSDEFGVRIGWKIISINDEDQPNNSKAIANALANAKKVKKPIAIVFSTEGLKPNLGVFNLFDNSEKDGIKTKNSRQRCCMPLNISAPKKNNLNFRQGMKNINNQPRINRGRMSSIAVMEAADTFQKNNPESGQFLLVWHDGEIFNSKLFINQKEGISYTSSFPSEYSYALYQTNSQECITNRLRPIWKNDQNNFRKKFEESVKFKQKNVNDFLDSKA